MCYIIVLFICSQAQQAPTPSYHAPPRGPSPGGYSSSGYSSAPQQSPNYPPAQVVSQGVSRPSHQQPTAGHGATAHMNSLEREQWGDRFPTPGPQYTQSYTQSYRPPPRHTGPQPRLTTVIGTMGSMGPPEPPGEEFRIVQRTQGSQNPTEFVSFSFF